MDFYFHLVKVEAKVAHVSN